MWTTEDPVGPSFWLSDGVAFFPLYLAVTPRGTWKHFVAVVDRAAGNVLSYGDGVFQGQTPIPTGFGSVSYVGPLTLGQGAGNPFTGSLDEVAVYNTALTSTQISNHFKAR